MEKIIYYFYYIYSFLLLPFSLTTFVFIVRKGAENKNEALWFHTIWIFMANLLIYYKSNNLNSSIFIFLYLFFDDLLHLHDFSEKMPKIYFPIHLTCNA
jgi:hypothetical protein